jgi:hypothetical protein
MVLSIVLSLLPLIILLFLSFNRSKLALKTFKVRYGSIYSYLNPGNLHATFYTVYFVLRRLLYALSIVYGGSLVGIQLLAQVLMSLLQLCYLVSVRPFTEPQDNALEIFNEGSILLILTCSLPFATGAESVVAVFNFGYLVIGLILFNIGVNFMLFMRANLQIINKKLLMPFRARHDRALKN